VDDLITSSNDSLPQESPGNSPRQLVWLTGHNFEGWGCSECAWLFRPTGPPIGQSLDEMKQNYQRHLSDEFASHACAHHLRVKVAALSS
jgi:hypothetical protein